MKKNNPNQGFTIIEALVATTVFAFIITAILGVYIAVSQLDTKTRAQRTVAQNARFIMEFLAKEVSNGIVDYAKYSSGSTSGVENTLYLINQSGEEEQISLSGENIVLTKAAGTSVLNSSGSRGVRVTRFRVIVLPTTNPLTTTRPPTVNEQPRVTVMMQLVSSFGSRATDLEVIDVQSTFTVRDYPSRLP